MNWCHLNWPRLFCMALHNWMSFDAIAFFNVKKSNKNNKAIYTLCVMHYAGSDFQPWITAWHISLLLYSSDSIVLLTIIRQIHEYVVLYYLLIASVFVGPISKWNDKALHKLQIMFIFANLHNCKCKFMYSFQLAHLQ